MAIIESVLRRLPEGSRLFLIRHRELVKFLVVGGFCYILTNVIWYGLKLTVLGSKPLTAETIGILVAMIVSYVLSREWSFKTRGGRERHHEAALFFLFSGIAIGLNVLPTAVSRYVFELQEPYVSLLTQELSDFVFGSIIGTLFGMIFRYWAFKKWVFPDVDSRRSGEVAPLRPEDAKYLPGHDGKVA
ncbi:MAG: GtrA family protein [Sciscionella sp.]